MTEQSSGEHDVGIEVLLFDKDARIRDGFKRLLTAAGLIVTATDDRDLVLNMVSDKLFATAIIDLDSPETDAGLGLATAIKKRSPKTSVIILTTRQQFSVAVDAFRKGVDDVVAKSPENVSYLTERIGKECRSAQDDLNHSALFKEVFDVHEDFLNRLMDASKAQVDALDRGSSQQTNEKCVVLVADGNESTARGLAAALEGEPFVIVSALTGGEALDKVGVFHLALVADDLPGLPAKMVAKSLRSERDEGIVVIFSYPKGNTPGRADIIEKSQEIELVRSLENGAQLVEQVKDLRIAFNAKAKERRYLQIFRRDHYDFLRRYVELKQKLLEVVAEK